VQPFGIGRCRAVPCAADRRPHDSSAEGTGSGERERHRLLQADVLSCSSVTSLGGPDNADGQVVERTRGGVQSGFGDMQVAGRGLKIAMAEQQLDTAQVGSGIEQMCCKRMSQYMRAQWLGDAELVAQLLTGDTHCVLKQGMVWPLSGEEPVLGLAPLPIDAQQLQQLGRQHDLARELALALADVNDHPLAVDWIWEATATRIQILQILQPNR